MTRVPRPSGYSGTPLPKKLGIKPDFVVALLKAPPGFASVLGRLPDGVRLTSHLSARSDLAVWFVRSVKELDRGIERVAASVPPNGVWIAWPKKASGVTTDVTEGEVRGSGLAHGLVDYKICAIDETWSGLKFAVRKQGRS